MPLSSTLRMSSSLFRHRLASADYFPSLHRRHSLSYLRFLSTSSSPLAHVQAPGKDGAGSENGSLSNEAQNGGLLVKSDNVGGRRGIVRTVLHKEATEAYMAYAMSVLLGRALPDVRDGLKPVHRRILYAMHELGLSSKKPFKKCARVVGEVLGKFHPHGDTAVYDALVRMAQRIFAYKHVEWI